MQLAAAQHSVCMVRHLELIAGELHLGHDVDRAVDLLLG